MTAVERYNALDGRTVSRDELEEIWTLAEKQGQDQIVEKIANLLLMNDDETFKITIGQKTLERVPKGLLSGLDCFEPEEEFTGLEKAVSPDQIYQMITDKMIERIKEASGKGYKSKWKKSQGYLIPFNFVSKKAYRGINSIMLFHPFMEEPMKNPFFLTFNQIEKLKGKLKKGSKGIPVVYFTQLYRFEQVEPALEFGTYDVKKLIAWFKRNRSKIDLLNKFSPESLAYQSSIPILKYYNVFRGEDVEGIDFDLENFKIGYRGSEIEGNKETRNEIADLIVKHYPAPQPPITHKGEQAFYRPDTDSITMPAFADFETGNDYYRTLFHEMTHSTGAEKRLNRSLKNKFGSPEYAKEELVAEFGAVFTSAHAGIVWYNNNNHAEYLKNWSMALKVAKDDNRFFMRAASKAQEAADFMLNLDKEGVPTYQTVLENNIRIKEAKKVDEKQKPSPKKRSVRKTSRGKQLKMALAAPWHNGKAKEALTECGRLKKGYKYSKGGEIVKVDEKKSINKTENLKKDPAKLKKKAAPAKKKAEKQKDTNQLLEEQKGKTLKAKTKSEFEIGLKKIGFDIISDTLKKNGAQGWKLQYKLNYKDIAGVSLDLEFQKRKKTSKRKEAEFVGISKIEAIGLNTDDYIHFNNVQEFYEEVLKELQVLFHMDITEAADVKKHFSDTLFQSEKPKAQLGLFGPKGQISISSDDFKNFSVSELREFILEYYNTFLKNKTIAIENSLKKVELLNRAGRKIAKGSAVYKTKAAVIEHFEEVLKNSTYNNWGSPKEKDSPDLLGYMNFKSKIVVDGKKQHVRIAIEVFKDRRTLLKSYDLGKKKPHLSKESQKLSSSPNEVSKRNKPFSINKDIKKKDKGLNSPSEIEPVATAPRNPKVKNMAAAGGQNNSSFFHVPGEVGKFLQAVEKKPVHSVVITLDGQQGAGKTTTLYKFMKAFADGKNRSLFASLEEHQDSSLAIEKRDKYLSQENQQYIDTVSDLDSVEEFYSLIPNYDIIFIDSWQKLQRMIGNIRLDEDLRKKFHGKVFVVIFQQTTTGRTKGGAEVVFDGDIIIKMVKEPRFADNYAYFDKNRYTKVPIETLRYNIASGTVYNPEGTTDVSDVHFEEVKEDPQIVENTKPTGRLIAVPVY